MAYIDLYTLYKEGVAVYCRVSTAGQNINQQISLAEVYFSKNNMEVANVQYFLDDNVSANKLTLESRPELNRLLLEIRKGKIKTVVVQNRDRLARNFYEHIDLVKEFYKYNVSVIFTDSGQAPFSKTLSIEALYGIFAQSEGRNIANRTGLAALQFPNSIYGFNVIGKRSEKRYIPNSETMRNVKALFKAVRKSDSAEELLAVIAYYKKEFKGDMKLLASLKNPFYAGHLKMKEQYIQLHHVDPIISIEDYLQVQICLAKFEKEIHESIAKANEKGIVQPICKYCKTSMSSRSSNLGEAAYYVCAKKGHSRIVIEVSRYNQLISEHLTYVLNKIDSKAIKTDVLACLLSKEKQYKKDLMLKDNKIKSLHSEIVNLLGSNKKAKINELIEKSITLETEMKQIHTHLMKIEEVRNGINVFIKLVNERLFDELQKYQQEYLIQLLLSKVELSNELIIYHTNFGHYIKGDELANECCS